MLATHTPSEIKQNFNRTIRDESAKVLISPNMGNLDHSGTKKPYSKNSPLIRLAVVAAERGVKNFVFDSVKDDYVAAIGMCQKRETMDRQVLLRRPEVPCFFFHFCGLNAVFEVREISQGLDTFKVEFGTDSGIVDFENKTHLNAVKQVHAFLLSQGWKEVADHLQLEMENPLVIEEDERREQEAYKEMISKMKSAGPPTKKVRVVEEEEEDKLSPEQKEIIKAIGAKTPGLEEAIAENIRFKEEAKKAQDAAELAIKTRVPSTAIINRVGEVVPTYHASREMLRDGTAPKEAIELHEANIRLYDAWHSFLGRDITPELLEEMKKAAWEVLADLLPDSTIDSLELTSNNGRGIDITLIKNGMKHGFANFGNPQIRVWSLWRD